MTTQEPARRERLALVVFADLIGSSEISDHLGEIQYAEIVEGFHVNGEELTDTVVRQGDVTKEFPSTVIAHSAQGDEHCIICACMEDDVPGSFSGLHSQKGQMWARRAILAGVKWALGIKAAWLSSDYNLNERVKRGRLPAEVAIGMHIGPVVAARSSREEESITARGFIGNTINVAKRVENESRNGTHTQGLVTPVIQYICSQALPDVVFRGPREVEMKGIFRPPHVSEIQEVLWSNYYTTQISSARKMTREDGDSVYRLAQCPGAQQGFRFLATVTLRTQEHEELATDLESEQLVMSEIIKAERIMKLWEGQREEVGAAIAPRAKAVLDGIENLPRGHPKIEKMYIQICQTGQDVQGRIEHGELLSARETECFVDGRWTTGGPEV